MSAPLPFARTGQIKTRPDTVIVDALPCMVWPAGTRVTDAGLTYDHTGEAPLAFYDDLRGSNRVLVIEGTEYIVVGCQRNTFLPHAALMLRRAEPSGA